MININDNTYKQRLEKLYDWMTAENIAITLFEDSEEHRDPAVRWLSGMPGDALLLLTPTRQSILIPWDTNIAEAMAQADTLIPYNEFGRQCTKALQKIAAFLKLPSGAKIEIPPVTPYPAFLEYVELLNGCDIICRHDGIHSTVVKARAIKDASEIERYRKIAAITNDIIDLLEQKIRAGKLNTEAKVALFIESEARARGCEGTGFGTLAAGPTRSFGIHAFPPYTAGPFATDGLSILDFGLKYQGYTSDVTLTFVRGDLAPDQEPLVILVQNAHDLAIKSLKPSVSALSIGKIVEDYFWEYEKVMPHNLGHGIGLEAHEGPSLRNRADNDWTLEPGMIFTIEPGLYDVKFGGCRLEDDILMTESGAEVLTKARIIQL
jgi:Xaa-Pro dipeptidase